jgi:hypothetical protein
MIDIAANAAHARRLTGSLLHCLPIAQPLVKPQYGPSLPALMRTWPRRRRMAVIAGIVLVVVLAAGLAVRRVVRNEQQTEVAVVEGPPAFNLIWRSGLERVKPNPGELLRLENPPGAPYVQRYVVRPLRIPPYRGDAFGVIPLYVGTVTMKEIQKDYPGAVERSEGKARINELPGYQVVFQTTVGGRVAYGRRVLLLPDEPGVRDGAQIEMLVTRSPAVPRADAVGANGPLKTPLRSFRFGTERP